MTPSDLEEFRLQAVRWDRETLVLPDPACAGEVAKIWAIARTAIARVFALAEHHQAQERWEYDMVEESNPVSMRDTLNTLGRLGYEVFRVTEYLECADNKERTVYRAWLKRRRRD